MWTLVQQEWRMHRRHAPVWASVIAIGLLMAVAGAIGRHWVDTQQRMQAAARANEAMRVKRQQEWMDKEIATLRQKNQPLSPVTFGSRHGTSIGHYEAKPYAILPPSSLAALAVGDTDVETGQILVSVDPKQFQGRDEVQQPLWRKAGRFDAAFMIAYILPILLLAVIGPAIAVDRDGPLRIIAAQGCPLWRVALIRVLVRGLPVLLTAIVAIWAIAWPVPSSALPQILWISLAVALYGLTWMMVALLFNATAKSATAAMAGVTSVWIVAALVIPALANVATVTLRPVSSRAELDIAVREAQQDAWANPGDRVMTAFFKEHPEIDPKSIPSLDRFMISQMRMVLEQEQRVEPLSRRYDAERRDQAALARSLRVLSPVSMIQHAIEESAGTGSGRRALFEAQVNRFFHAWQDFFVPKIYYRVPVNSMSEVPKFTFIDEDWLAAVSRSLADLALLAALAAGLTITAIRACDTMLAAD
jgi:ABC-2 type transport system permease protein